MLKSRTNQYVVVQNNHSAGDAVPIHKNTIRYTVKNHPQSGANLFIGINQDANEGNLLEPGESMSIGGNPGYYVADQLYLTFDDGGSNGKALVLVEIDLQEEACD